MKQVSFIVVLVILFLLPVVLAEVDNTQKVFTKNTAIKLEEVIGNHPVCVQIVRNGNAKKAIASFKEKPTCQTMVYYAKNSKKIIILQPEKKLLLDDDVRTIIVGFEEEKKKNLPQALLHAVERLVENLENIPKQDNLCVKIKDGVCDKQCPGVDLDCLCGNNVCEYFETGTCVEDCGKKEWLCTVISNGLCEENCVVKDIDCRFDALRTRIHTEREKRDIGELKLIYSLAILLAFGLFGGTYWLHRQLLNKGLDKRE